MVVAEYYTDDIKKHTGMPISDVLSNLNALGAPSTVSEDGKKLVVELTPNRLDLLHWTGISRALRLFTGKARPHRYSARPSKYAVIVDRSVASIRPYTVGAVVKGLLLSERELEYLIQFQEKLLVTVGRNVKKLGIGIYPLDAFDFPIRYTALPPEKIIYRPLGFPGQATAMEILERHPKGRQYGAILQQFSRYPVFMDAHNRILSLVPICNSEECGKVTPETKDIFGTGARHARHSCLRIRRHGWSALSGESWLSFTLIFHAGTSFAHCRAQARIRRAVTRNTCFKQTVNRSSQADGYHIRRPHSRRSTIPHRRHQSSGHSGGCCYCVRLQYIRSNDA